jgi:hypothetical protein
MREKTQKQAMGGCPGRAKKERRVDGNSACDILESDMEIHVPNPNLGERGT